jgi:hypothetical protein
VAAAVIVVVLTVGRVTWLIPGTLIAVIGAIIPEPLGGSRRTRSRRHWESPACLRGLLLGRCIG